MMFKQIENWNYEVSKAGVIRNAHTGQVLCLRKNGNTDYLTTFIRVNGKPKIVSVHRLVAILFVPNPNKLNEVNHIDGNKKNNHFQNLEWVSLSQNMIHMYRSGLKKYKPIHYKGKTGSQHNRSISVKCVETNEIFGSMSEAERAKKLGSGSVSWSIKHKRPIYGMHFEIGVLP